MTVYQLIHELSYYSPNDDVFIVLAGERDEFEDNLIDQGDDLHIEGYIDEVERRAGSKSPAIKCSIW